MKVTRLRMDAMENPVGYDFDCPTLSWVVESNGVNRCQSAYQLQIARDADFTDLAYDSEKVISEQSIGLRLALALEARTRYHWRVKVWNDLGDSSDFSEGAFFETGRMGEPWRAEWIGWDTDFPQLRRVFSIEKPVRRARLYACGVGFYCLFLNGARVGDEELTPGINAYDLWLAYQTYDVTDQLRPGKNAIGAWLADGYYRGRIGWPTENRRNRYGDKLALIAEMVIEYEDGSCERVRTDGCWKATRSPFLRTEVYDGEVFDARRFDPDWCTPETSDTDWEIATMVPLDKSLLLARKNLPVAIMETIDPIACLRTPAGETVLDFGQNFAGRVRIRTNAPEGTRIRLQYGEAIDTQGNFYRDNLRSARAEMIYISNGRPAEYAPYFTFYGFRYVKVEGWPGSIDLSDFTGEVMYSRMEVTGEFECSDARVNRLFQNAMWGQKSNFIDLPTDCPQRDERLGWTGDAQLFCATACMNMEAGAFYRKYLYDLRIEQAHIGYVPNAVPNFMRCHEDRPTAAWGDAAAIIPWTIYLYYGDITILAAQYESMKAWVDYVREQDEGGEALSGWRHLGDWLAMNDEDPDNAAAGRTPKEMIATAFYAHSASLLSKAAARLGKAEDARLYGRLSEQVREKFRQMFVSPDGRIASGTQTSYALALGMDMLRPEQRTIAAKHLAECLRNDGMTSNTGIVGTPHLCPALSDAGFNEYAYALLLNTRCPGWLYAVERGATTIWERWNSVHEDGHFAPTYMNSLNHYAFGSIVEWLYRYVAGINPVADAPGFRRILLRPMPNAMLRSARASVQTVYGRVSSDWALEGDRLALMFVIPFGARAEIVLPDAEGMVVWENGKERRETCFVRGSGTWRYAYVHNGRTIDRRVPDIG